MKTRIGFFVIIFFLSSCLIDCFSQDKNSIYIYYKSNLNFGSFYNPFLPAFSANVSYDRFIGRKDKIAFGIVYNYAWLGSEYDNGQSIGFRALYRFLSNYKFNIYGGIGGSYGNIRFSPFYKESSRFTYYVGGKYFFSNRFGALLEVSNYRFSGEIFPIIGLTYRYGLSPRPFERGE